MNIAYWVKIWLSYASKKESDIWSNCTIRFSLSMTPLQLCLTVWKPQALVPDQYYIIQKESTKVICWIIHWIISIPFFLEVLAWNSFSSILTEILLYFMRQKNERRAPEHSRAAPTGRSAWTCRPAGDMTGLLNVLSHTHKLTQTKRTALLLASISRSRGYNSEADNCSFTFPMSFGCT